MPEVSKIVMEALFLTRKNCRVYAAFCVSQTPNKKDGWAVRKDCFGNVKLKQDKKLSPGVIKGKEKGSHPEILIGIGIYSGVLILLRHCVCIHMEVPLSG